MLRYLKHYVAALDGVAVWPLVSLGIFFLFFVVLLWRVARMQRAHVDEIARLPLNESSRAAVAPVLLSTVVVADSSAAAEVGTHFGMADDAWILLLLVSALLLTALIVAAHGILRNLVEYRAEMRRKLRVSGLGVLATTFVLSDGSFWAMVFAVSVLAGYLMLFVYQIHSFAADLRPRREVEPEVAEEETRPGWWARLATLLNAHESMDKEEDLLLDHAFDGSIRELDNRLPPWWLYGFYVSIAFAGVYMVRYHIVHAAPLSAELYEIEVAEAEAARTAYLEAMAANVDESTVVFDPTPERLGKGGALFATHCISCHAPDGGGGVGPNLTDPYWLHGGTISDLFATVKYGVPAKGMKSWEAELTPVDMQNVTTYILSLQGTTPAEPKPPQGTLAAVPDSTAAN